MNVPGCFFIMETIFKAGYSTDKETFLADEDGYTAEYDTLENAVAVEMKNAEDFDDYYIAVIEVGKNNIGKFDIPISSVEIIRKSYV